VKDLLPWWGKWKPGRLLWAGKIEAGA
jgi:hypothetical protein